MHANAAVQHGIHANASWMHNAFKAELEGSDSPGFKSTGNKGYTMHCP